jgi:hypothetical protein
MQQMAEATDVCKFLMLDKQRKSGDPEFDPLGVNHLLYFLFQLKYVRLPLFRVLVTWKGMLR